MLYRLGCLSIALYAFLTAVDLAPAAQSERRQLDCAGAFANIELALNEHVVFSEINDTLVRRTGIAFLENLLSYSDLFSTRVITTLRAEKSEFENLGTSSVLLTSLLSQMRAKDCSYFEQRSAVLRNAIKATRSRFNDDALSLTRVLNVGPSARSSAVSGIEKSTQSLVLERLRQQVKSLERSAPRANAALFTARRFFLRLNQLERQLNNGAEPMLRAFMGSLDPYSRYRNSEQTDLDRKLLLGPTYSGIGVWLDEPTPLGVRVNKVIEGGPAANERLLHAGDIITAIEGDLIIGLGSEDLHPLLTGLEGSRVTLTVATQKGSRLIKRRQVVVTRGAIRQSASLISVAKDLVNGKNIVTLRLSRFYSGASSDLERIIREQHEQHEQHEIDALVLDLRGNRGGLIDEAQRLVGLFIDGGAVYGVETRKRIYQEMDVDQTALKMPLLVAIDSETASAAELVAGTLKDYGRALIVGDARSFGKGTMQRIFGDRDGVFGGTLFVTTARYYTASGSSVQSEGVAADIVVESTVSKSAIKEKNNPNAIAHAVIKSMMTDQDFARNSDPTLKAVVPLLQAQSMARALSDPLAIDQLREIQNIAADYVKLGR